MSNIIVLARSIRHPPVPFWLKPYSLHIGTQRVKRDMRQLQHSITDEHRLVND